MTTGPESCRAGSSTTGSRSRAREQVMFKGKLVEECPRGWSSSFTIRVVHADCDIINLNISLHKRFLVDPMQVAGSCLLW